MPHPRTYRSSSSLVLDNTVASGSDESESTSTQNHLDGFLKGYERQKKELKRLRRENERLKRKPMPEVEALPASSGELERLREEVQKLTKKCKKLGKKITQLEQEQAAAEANDLNDSEGMDGDMSLNKDMKGYLRKIQFIVTQNTLAEDEECAVCMERFKIPGTSSLPCDHPFCDDCISKLTQPLQCPNCRKAFTTEQVQPVTMSASQQWDELLKVVHSWAMTDINQGKSRGIELRVNSDASSEDENRRIGDNTEEGAEETANAEQEGAEDTQQEDAEEAQQGAAEATRQGVAEATRQEGDSRLSSPLSDVPEIIAEGVLGPIGDGRSLRLPTPGPSNRAGPSTPAAGASIADYHASPPEVKKRRLAAEVERRAKKQRRLS